MSSEQQSAVLMLRMTPTLKRACESAAKRSGLTVPDWMRAVLAMAANQGAFAPRKGGADGGTTKK